MISTVYCNLRRGQRGRLPIILMGEVEVCRFGGCQEDHLVAPGGMAFRVLNRGVRQIRPFDEVDACAAFERVVEELSPSLPEN